MMSSTKATKGAMATELRPGELTWIMIECCSHVPVVQSLVEGNALGLWDDSGVVIADKDQGLPKHRVHLV